EPLGHMPNMTWDDVWQYEGDCLDLLIPATEDPRPQVSERAIQLAPRALSFCISRGLVDPGLPLLQRLVDRTLGGQVPGSVNELADAIAWCRSALRDDAHGGVGCNAATIDGLSALLTRIRCSAFATRMQLWVGGWLLDLDNIADPAGESNAAIADLAV